jgi:hypothetical protein
VIGCGGIDIGRMGLLEEIAEAGLGNQQLTMLVITGKKTE